MRRVYLVGIPPEDLKAKRLVEKVAAVNGARLVTVSYDSRRPEGTDEEPDFVVLSSEEGRTVKSQRVPTVLIGDFFNRASSDLPEGVYAVGNSPVYLHSIFRALAKSARRIRVELKGGTVLNLTFSLKETVIEKKIPTGRREKKVLTYKEGAILKELFSKPGSIVPYERLVEMGIKEENIPVYVSRLRKTLSELDPELKIKSVRNRGYLLTYGL